MWARLARQFSTDFVAWYGTASCLASDQLVLPDPRSPSKFRFRASRHAALQAYRRAFELRPTVLGTLRAGGFQSARELFHTHRSYLLSGKSGPADTLGFLAYPAWTGDTLSFVPYPSPRIQRADPAARPSTVDIAVQHQRELFHEVAVTWATALPESPAALEALAVSLELLGRRAALDTIARARREARGTREAVRTAAAEVWMRIKFAIPDDTISLRHAIVLMDSLLQPSMLATEPEAEPLLGLAVLTGRAIEAAELSRRTARETDWGLPDPIAEYAPALLTYSALGGPMDSLMRLESAVANGIDQLRPTSAQAASRAEWLSRSAVLAFPTYHFVNLTRLAGMGYAVIDADLASLKGDTALVRRTLGRIAEARIGIAPGDLSLDALYPEASLLTALRDQRGAAAWLDPTLNSLTTSPPYSFSDPARAGTLVRAMALRAELASTLGDTAQARRWAIPVTMLWNHADGFLQSVVQRMNHIARNGN